jgi:tetratricopeptide (TPR) repeat protein
VLDYQGRESEAVALYRRAQALGLAGDDRLRLYVQLGSTLRNVGETAEAVRFLNEGRERFPKHAAITAFYSLALLSSDRCREAVALLDLIAAHQDVIGLTGYERDLHLYTDELRGDSS